MADGVDGRGAAGDWSDLGRRPLAEVLRSDGTIDTAAADGHALDPRGHTVVAGPDGAPRFAPAAPADGEGTPQGAPVAPATGRRLPEDDAWSPVFGCPTLAPDVLAVAVQGTTVYVGGGFTYGMAGMANGTYNRVAAWDGSGWVPMGQGVDGTVHALAVVGTDVYVGGDLTVAGGTVAAAHLARWDGQAWHPVAGGLTDPDRAYGTTVRALAFDGAVLHVGGSFTRAGDLPVRSLASLDLGTGTWSDAGGGVATSWGPDPATVHALSVDGTALYVGGSFDLAGEVATASFARLDTATGAWTGYGSGVTDDGLPGAVHALAVDAATGDVFVGGRFAAAGEVESWNLAVLRDGAFTSIGNVGSYGAKYAEVLALAVSGGSLYAGGTFTTVGNATAPHWARHDGTTWSVPGDGLDGAVRAMAPTGERGVVVLGEIATSGTLRLVRGGIWTGAGWETFGQGVAADPDGGGAVHAVLPDGDGAFVGGLFDQAGQLPVASVARWTGTAWDPLAGGVGATYSHGQVFALTRLGGDVYAAGRFERAGGTIANNIARWDGTRWAPLGEGLDDAAYALAVARGRLYVGGTFNLAGRVAAGHLACWDPATETWSPVGGSPTYDDDIRAMAVIGDRWLVLGGTFARFFHRGVTIVDGLWGMALFDTHRAPSDDPLAGYHLLEGTSRYGAPGWVHALQVVGGDLYVGGWFDVAGILTLGPAPTPGFPAANVAVWHFGAGTGWEAVGGGTDHQVQALTDVDGTVAAGGWFATAGNVGASRVARYDPADGRWSALGSGLGDGARGASWALALAQSPRTGLWVGGEFPAAGGAPSDNVALWTATRHGG